MDTGRNGCSRDPGCLSPSLTVRNSHSFTKHAECMRAQAPCVPVYACRGASAWDRRRRKEAKTAQGSLQVQKLQVTFIFTVEAD